MTMNFKLFAAVAATSMALIGTSAHAQSASNFGGLKAGVVLGYDNTDLVGDVEAELDNAEGFLYGLTAGYDYDLGTAVIGVEAEVTLNTAKWPLGEGVELRAGRDLYIGARVGLPVTNALLAYAKAGYTNGRVEYAFDEGLEFVAGENLNGYRVGAGLEYATGTKFGRIEYRYSDYTSSEAFFDVDASRHQVVATVGVRF